MSILEDYEKKFGLNPITPEKISILIWYAEKHMQECTERSIRTNGADLDRALIWLHDRLQSVYSALYQGIPGSSRCAWCFRSGPATNEAWAALPKMTLDDAAAHSQVCEHNPLVVQIRELEADIEARQVALERDL